VCVCVDESMNLDMQRRIIYIFLYPHITQPAVFLYDTRTS